MDSFTSYFTAIAGDFTPIENLPPANEESNPSPITGAGGILYCVVA